MTVQMNISKAKAKLSELVAAAETGEEVVLARSEGVLSKGLFRSRIVDSCSG